MFGWIKNLFCKKEDETEEVISPNPSQFIVKLLEWVEPQTELPDCKFQYEKKDDKITDEWLQRGDSTKTYYFKHEDKIIEICHIKTGSTSYKDKYGLFASDMWRYTSHGSDIYLIRSISLFSKVKQEWVEISTSALLDMNINEDNKPYLKKIFDKVADLYYSSSDEMKDRIRRCKETKAKDKEIILEFLSESINKSEDKII